MANETRKPLAQLEHDGNVTLELALLHARKLESLAQRMQRAAAGGLPADKAALRSTALRLEHTANEAFTALVSVIVQSARLEMLATIRASLEPKSTDSQ